MVAYTDPDCLPYMEGGDGACLNTGTVCEPSTVFCDFATAVETRLDAFDEVVELADSVPMAWVQTTTQLRLSIGGLANLSSSEYDTVIVDTANMANLDTLSTGLTVTRDGLYMAFCNAIGSFTTFAALPGTIFLTMATSPPLQHYGAATFTSLTTSYQAPSNNTIVSVTTAMPLVLSAGQTATNRYSVSGNTGDFFLINQATMALLWMGDMP